MNYWNKFLEGNIAEGIPDAGQGTEYVDTEQCSPEVC